MALPQVAALDANGDEALVNTPNSGRQLATDSQSVVISTEDLAALAAVGTKLDSVTSLLGSTNTKLDSAVAALNTLDGRVDGLEGLATTANSLATTLNGYVDGVEALIGATNTLITSTNTKLDAANTSLDAVEAAATDVDPADVNLGEIGGNTISTGNGTAGTGTQRVTIASDNTAFPVKLAQDEYETVAASASDQALGATGAVGDYLSHVTVFPATTSPGAVTIKDGATTVAAFPGGTLPSVIPFTISIGAKSVSGAWNLTTGTNVAAVGFGDFT